jgi:hypothetical protein
VKYLLFIFLVFSLDLAASESFTFTEKVSSECKGEALEAEKLHIKYFRTHLKKVQLDDFYRLMTVRRILLKENAPESIKKIDTLLTENLSALINENVIIKEQLTSINNLMDEFATYPITANVELFQDIKVKINQLNSGI